MRQIRINKYWIYLFIISILLSVTIIPKLWKAITYAKTKGVVRQFTFTEYKTGRKSTKYYPVVDFTVNGIKYSCIGSSFQHDEFYIKDSVAVLYKPSNPKDAYVYSFLGYYASTVVWLIPLVLFITLAFGMDYIPKYL